MLFRCNHCNRLARQWLCEIMGFWSAYCDDQCMCCEMEIIYFLVAFRFRRISKEQVLQITILLFQLISKNMKAKKFERNSVRLLCHAKNVNVWCWLFTIEVGRFLMESILLNYVRPRWLTRRWLKMNIGSMDIFQRSIRSYFFQLEVMHMFFVFLKSIVFHKFFQRCIVVVFFEFQCNIYEFEISISTEENWYANASMAMPINRGKWIGKRQQSVDSGISFDLYRHLV